MAFTTTTHESWGKRLANAFALIIIGLLLLVGGCVLLFWNEGRAVKTAQALEEGAEVTVSVPDPSRLDSALEGKLVHVSGRARTESVLDDSEFGLSVPAIRLTRRVQYYQWVEEEETHEHTHAGGSTTTTYTYTYRKEWCDQPVSSTGFQEAGHGNSVAHHPQGGNRSWYGQPVTLGAYELTRSQIDRIGQAAQVDPTAHSTGSSVLGERLLRTSGYTYIGHAGGPAPDPASPRIGEVRICWYAVPQEQDLSLVAQQRGKSFEPYIARSSGYEVDLLDNGLQSAEALFTQAHKENTITTWLLRLGGAVLIFFGLAATLHFLSVLGDVIPFVGALVGGATLVIAFIGAFVLSLGTVALAWVWYRPVLAAVLAVVALGPVVWRGLRRRG